ncbi:MAG TPA: hypothetical protein VES65_11315 [Solirubrobacteraceae bacterium]|nr:hypothetical protein [Solirubrobacteraceae bacterium]
MAEEQRSAIILQFHPKAAPARPKRRASYSVARRRVERVARAQVSVAVTGLYHTVFAAAAAHGLGSMSTDTLTEIIAAAIARRFPELADSVRQ